MALLVKIGFVNIRVTAMNFNFLVVNGLYRELKNPCEYLSTIRSIEKNYSNISCTVSNSDFDHDLQGEVNFFKLKCRIFPIYILQKNQTHNPVITYFCHIN